MAIKVKVVNMIPQSQSNETNDDSEANVAVDLANPQIVGGTVFTATPTAVIFLSSDGEILGPKQRSFPRPPTTITRSSAGMRYIAVISSPRRWRCSKPPTRFPEHRWSRSTPSPTSINLGWQ
jgi:hypothetical protein